SRVSSTRDDDRHQGGGREPAPDAPAATAGASSTPAADFSTGPAPEREAEPGGRSAADVPLELSKVRVAWRSVLEEGEGVPTGTSLMLRAARLELASADTIAVHVPPGSPLLDRLGKSSSRRPLEVALERRLGRSVRLELRASESAEHATAGGRITAETARQERLRRLVEEEPLLAAAVQEWDLELID